MLLKDRKLIVTGGPTREWLDPVRFISNPSTGKMGRAIAEAGLGQARETVFIHGPVNLPAGDYRRIAVETTEDMLNAVLEELEDGAALVMAAAPADYGAAVITETKIKKAAETMTLELKKTPDILKAVAAKRSEGAFKDMFTAGFAAETNNTEEYALAKLKEKNLDMICLNDVSKKAFGFGSDYNELIIYSREGKRYALPPLPKSELARLVLGYINDPNFLNGQAAVDNWNKL